MSPPPMKKPHIGLETPENTESSSESEDDIQDTENQEELQVEFEARSAEAGDYHGICRLIKQTFRTGVEDIGSLADTIISQKTVGSVITQSRCGIQDEEEEEDDEEFDDLSGEIFGLMTVIGLKRQKTVENFVRSLLENPSGSTSPSVQGALNILKDDSRNAGLLISERIVNIPPQISTPLYQTLSKELNKAKTRGIEVFKFTHLFLLSRVLVDSAPKASSDGGSDEVFFINNEEEVLEPECEYVIDVIDTEPVYRADWALNKKCQEKRKLFVFESSKLESITSLIAKAFPVPT